MLHPAVLILAIVSAGRLSIDYEVYEDAKYCHSVASYINEYYKDGPIDNKVTAICVDVSNNINV